MYELFVIGSAIAAGARWLHKDAASKDARQSKDTSRGMDGFVEYVESKREPKSRKKA